jgi:RsiW-degrading membrane proteinase PrsW (M82 family)
MIGVLFLILSMIPGILVFLWFRKFKEDEPYKKTCGDILKQGLLSRFVLVACVRLFSILWGLTGFSGKNLYLDEFINGFIKAAFFEELVKMMLTFKIMKKNRIRVSKLDLMVFFCIMGMGFGASEALVYMFNTSPRQILFRGLTLGHGTYGLIMGSFFAKYYESGKESYKYLAFLVPFLIHGFYDFGLSEGVADIFGIISVTSVGVLFVYLVVKLIRINKHRNDPEATAVIHDFAELRKGPDEDEDKAEA